MKCFYRFLAGINKTNVQILDLPSEELDHLLEKFFEDVRKINGEEYEPSTLTRLQTSIQRFLFDSGSKMNILKDDEFAFSRKVLEAKCKNLVVQGKGNRPNATRSLTEEEEEEKLFQSGAFGGFSPCISGSEPVARVINCAGETFPCRRIQLKMATKCLFG